MNAGQYLRWDYRSGRRQGKKIFDKGVILAFDRAITDKLHQIVDDLQAGDLPEDLFAKTRSKADVTLRGGSCLDILPELKAESYDCLITSPPYCNRYDYRAGFVANFLQPAGANFVEEFVFRFLLTRGDTLGGSMRNVGGLKGQVSRMIRLRVC